MVDHLANSDKETQDKAVKNANQFLQQVVESKTGEKLERFTDRTGRLSTLSYLEFRVSSLFLPH